MHDHPDLHNHGDPAGEVAAHAHDHGIAKYLYVFAALTVMTTASFMTYTDLWRDNIKSEAAGWTFMMAVSCTKALLVMLFFMHLKWEASWKYVLTIPASVMAVFLGLALVPDVKWRYPEITGGREASSERKLHSYQKDRDAPPGVHGGHGAYGQ